MKIEKKKSIVATVVASVSATIFLLSGCLSFAVWNALQRELSAMEKTYMSEVITRISLEVNVELNHYIDTAQSLAQSHTIKEFLYNIENGTYIEEEVAEEIWIEEQWIEEQWIEEQLIDGVLVEGYLQEGYLQEGYWLPAETTETNNGEADSMDSVVEYEHVLEELSQVGSVLGETVHCISLISSYWDNFITFDGVVGDENFTLSTRPYYPAYTTKSTYISDPFQDALTGEQVLAFAEPIMGDDGRVLGLIVIEMTMEQVANIVTSTSFGETGATIIMDRNNSIIAYPDPRLVGMNISDLDYSGDEADSQLANPTGEILKYNFGDTVRIGGIVTISDLSGWKMLSAVDSSEINSNISKVVVRLNLGMLFAVFICALLCARVIYRNLKPMAKLENFMEELAKGKLTGTVDFHEPNEIGRLAGHMNYTASTLSGYISTIDHSMKEFGNGNFVLPDNMDFQGDFRSIQSSMEQFVALMSRSLSEIKLSMDQMNVGAEQVASGAQMLSNGSSQQASSVDGLNGLIGDINQTITITAKNSSSVTTDAVHIRDDLVGSNEKMHELVVSIQDIRSMSDEVKRIIKSIEDVAFQTNILSLNASVEAARAGTAGRGFAVVADQVRMLSASTAEAAEKTTKIITDIATAIETGTELAQSTSRELQQVVDEVGVFVDKISHISLSAQNQADAIAEINRGIEEISQVVIQNSAVSQESAAASEELSAQTDQIVDLVDRFKLE